jgi:SAM-dependent methyltransferase
MDRNEWIKEQRRETEERYDTIWAPLYGEKWGLYSNATHQQFIGKFLTLLPQPGTLLDAACGAGRYMGMLLEGGHTVVGIDQSQGMLARTKIYYPAVHTEKMGLQEMPYSAAFEGAICMDALEHVCPEDWPRILHNFHRALKPHGILYFTVELPAEHDLEAALLQGQEARLPVVYGELADHGVYHYYPSLSQVREWLQQAKLDVLEEGAGDGYHHFLTLKA